MTTNFDSYDSYKETYQDNIDEAIKSIGLDNSLKDRIYRLLYFLHKFDKLLANRVTSHPKNSEQYFKDILKKYKGGKDGIEKPSLEIRKPINIGDTIPDQMVRLILKESEKCDDEKVDTYIDGHNLAMSAENLLGKLLEGYIASVIDGRGEWIWCPGQIIFATDFIYLPVTDFDKQTNKKVICLQVKNADNSENSSSSKIRQSFRKKVEASNIDIEVWFRSKSRWSLASLKNEIHHRLQIEGNNKLERPIEKTEKPNSAEEWIEHARKLGYKDLVDKPKRDTNWDKLNKRIVELSGTDQSISDMSEENFEKYILSLYSNKECHREKTENSDQI